MAKAVEEQSCITCKWAKAFQRTTAVSYHPTGRLQKGTIGRCSYKVDWPALPFFFAPGISTLNVPEMGGYGSPSDCWSRGILPDDGKDCKCYKRALNGGSEQKAYTE
jgi:hypothetical protein